MIGANLFNFRHNDKTAFRAWLAAEADSNVLHLTKVNTFAQRRDSYA